MFLTDSKQLTGSMKILQNTIRRGVNILSNRSPSSELASPRTPSHSTEYSTRSQPTLTRNVLAGKYLDTYIFPSADFWASRVNYLDTYTINLEYDDNFPVFYVLGDGEPKRGHSSFLSLSSDDIICVEGYPTHMISPALLLAFANCSPFPSLSSDDHYRDIYIILLDTGGGRY